MAGLLKKMLSGGFKKNNMDHHELFQYKRTYPRFQLPTKDYLEIQGHKYLIRDMSLNGISIWVTDGSDILFSKNAEQVNGEINFFDNTNLSLILNVVRYDTNVVAFEISRNTSSKEIKNLSLLLGPIELGRSLKFVPNQDRKLTTNGPTYWYRGRNNTDLFVWVDRDKIQNWQLTFNGTYIEFSGGRFLTGNYDEHKQLKEPTSHTHPFILLDKQSNFQALRDGYALLKSAEDEKGVIGIILKQIKEE